MIPIHFYAQSDSVALKKDAKFKKTIEVNYNNLVFTEKYSAWHFGYLQLAFKKPSLSILPRINFNSRFSKLGIQAEVDVYKKIKSTVFYLNYGYSPTQFYPIHRFGLEAYRSLPYKLEASLGLRVLNFEKNTPLFYTTSIGKYYKNYWFSYRAFIVPLTDNINWSHIGMVRKYLKKDEEYIGFLIGLGAATTDNALNVKDMFFLRSYRLGFQLNKFIATDWMIKPSFEISKQELSFRPKYYQTMYAMSLSVSKKIKQ
ncbi:MAG: YaiO family outer membrane beta-barrel protein [Pseudarcicella sp.]|nr:YaiO family outer membrane beta-barrel protein [Pseudarcicella sp.]